MYGRNTRNEGYEVFWIRNIEQGTRGAWHIHLIINEIGDTASIIQKALGEGRHLVHRNPEKPIL